MLLIILLKDIIIIIIKVKSKYSQLGFMKAIPDL